MKELSIEEKAKRYDEAIERANSLLSSNQLGNAWIYKLLPALKESDDERIRENIIATIHLYYGEPLEDEAKEMIAWLEKQGEHKPANWLQELEDKLANATPKQLAEWKEKYFNEEPAEWSDEDESNLDSAIYYIRREPYLERNVEPIVDWLRNLKDRVQLK